MKKNNWCLWFFSLCLTIVSLSALGEIKKNLVFATEATYPPFEFVDVAGRVQGFDVEIASALCKQMQVDCKFVNQPWDSLIPSLKIGKFDALIGAIQITEARKQQVDFTEPYYVPTASFVGAKDAKLALTPESLQNKTVGVQSGTTMEQYVQGVYGSTVKIKSYSSIQDALLDLTSGRVDLVFGDTPIVIDWIKNHGQSDYVIVGEPVHDEKYFGIGDGIAVRKGDTELLDALNKALKEIKANGVYDAITKKYFGKS